MSALINRVKRAITWQNNSVVHECRRCGTNCDRHTESCPACGAGDIAYYHIQ